MADGGLRADGFDLASLGVTVTEGLRGWRDGLERTRETAARPGRVLSVPLTRAATTEPRRATVEAVQEADDVATLLSRRDELMARLDAADRVEVVFDDQPGRFLRARVDGSVRVRGVVPDLAQTAHQVSIPLVGRDPRWLADAETVVTVGSGDGDVDVPLGTAESLPTIEVSVGTFTLTYKDASGAVVATLGVSGASASPVTVDMEAQTIISANGSELDARVAGSRFFALDPRDGDFAASSWPTLATDAGTATVTYRKAWH